MWISETMKKSKFIFAVVFATSLLLGISCSSDSVENETAPQNKTAVLKTEKMLRFESGLKDWFKVQAEQPASNGQKAASPENVAIEGHAVVLLNELGVSQSEIDSRKAVSTNQLVHFALQEYSKKLAQMYNQTQH